MTRLDEFVTPEEQQEWLAMDALSGDSLKFPETSRSLSELQRQALTEMNELTLHIPSDTEIRRLRMNASIRTHSGK